jgi:hypothetical protein
MHGAVALPPPSPNALDQQNPWATEHVVEHQDDLVAIAATTTPHPRPTR